MTLAEAKQLCTLLYYTATGKHNVDDRQWTVLLDVMNKKYWNEVVRAIGSIYAVDTPDIITDGYGQLDFGGSAVVGNDLRQVSVNSITSTVGGWTLVGVNTAANAAIGPDGTNSAWKIISDLSVGSHYIGMLPPILPDYQNGQGVITIFAKAGTARYLWIGNGGSAVQWYDLLNGSLGTFSGTVGTCSISPVSQPGFGYYVTTTSGTTPNTSASGWYKCVFRPSPTETVSEAAFGISIANGTASFSGSTVDVYIALPRRSYVDNMIDGLGVHLPLAVELKFFGRYIKLDYEIPQDRYIYNIAFGQVQVLIPSAWTLLGEKITLLPRVTGAQTLRVSYIPRLADLVADEQQLLAGKLPTYHPLIAYEVATSMLPRDADRSGVVAPLIELRQQLKNYLQSRQRQDGRKIRFVPYE